jgi:hypothetical protein
MNNNKSGERYPRYNPVRAGGLCLCSSDFNRLLLLKKECPWGGYAPRRHGLSRLG